METLIACALPGPGTSVAVPGGSGGSGRQRVRALAIMSARTRRGMPAGRLMSASVLVPVMTASASRPCARRMRRWRTRRRQAQLASPAATDPGAIAVFGCFAPDGSQHCSGLPVARYSPAQLARQVGAKWLLISQDREEHITPGGAIQPFTWIALRR